MTMSQRPTTNAPAAHELLGRRAALRRAQHRRRRFALIVAAGVALAATLVVHLAEDARQHDTTGAVVFDVGGTAVARMAIRAGGGQIQSTVAKRLPVTATVRRGAATVSYRLDTVDAAARAARLPSGGGRVDVPVVAYASSIVAPPVRQSLHNDCEAAALQILLQTRGVDVDQLKLQAAMPLNGPLDPQGTGAQQLWGDPSLGFVGRAAGGGPAGGFGVYQQPIAQLSRRYGRRLNDLTGDSPEAIYRRLLDGHAVMAWVGLSQGPFGSWRTPEGREIQVNFGEHTVVLTGLRPDGTLEVDNPLTGQAEDWPPQQFVSMWDRLGRRALS